MKAERRLNILKDFDFRLLDNEDFGEDSVREEIIVPILKGLGYGHSKPNRIIRSKNLLHPFVSIGSARKNIYLIPDYLFEVGDRYAWILEAKAPNEKILNTKHVEQAYSYAMHSEIRVPYFALCNGREFVLYHISKNDPVIHFDMRILPSFRDELIRLLAPHNVLTYDFNLKKDFGFELIMNSILRITNTIELLCACWDEAEATLHYDIKNNCPDIDEEAITQNFHAKLSESLRLASNARRIEYAFLKDLQTLFFSGYYV